MIETFILLDYTWWLVCEVMVPSIWNDTFTTADHNQCFNVLNVDLDEPLKKRLLVIVNI